MEIYQLRTFVTVAQQGHLTQAAELLHLSQPAVTAQIKAIEEEAGMPLFERAAGGVSLTRAGQELLPMAQSILAAAQGLLNHAKGLRGQLSGKTRVGIALSPDLLRLGPWVAALAEKYPLLDVSLRYGVTGEVINLVRKKELDAGFFLGKNPYVNVNSIPLAQLEFCLVMPSSWQDKVDVSQPKALGRLPWVGVSQFSSLSKITSELWRELNIAPKKVAECDHLATMVELAAAGVGMVLSRREVAEPYVQAGRLVIVPGIEKAAELQFVYPADRLGDPVLDVLLEELAMVWGLSREQPPQCAAPSQ